MIPAVVIKTAYGVNRYVADSGLLQKNMVESSAGERALAFIIFVLGSKLFRSIQDCKTAKGAC